MIKVIDYVQVNPFQTGNTVDPPAHSVGNKSGISWLLIFIIVSGLIILTIIGYWNGSRRKGGNGTDISTISAILQEVYVEDSIQGKEVISKLDTANFRSPQ
jgi:purine-cytosine permease-like protein